MNKQDKIKKVIRKFKDDKLKTPNCEVIFKVFKSII